VDTKRTITSRSRGSLVVANEGNILTDTLVRTGELRRVATVPVLNGTTSFTILER
jgi:hypothetical protein